MQSEHPQRDAQQIPTPIDIDSMLSDKTVPIKSEFRDSRCTGDSQERDTNEIEERPRKRAKMSRNRKKRHAYKKSDYKLDAGMCNYILSDRECPYGENCKMSHNLQKYLEQKPQDIGPRCYVYDQTGNCPYKYACRFYQGHSVSAPGNQEQKEQSLVLNELKPEIRTQLRSNQNDLFAQSNEIITEYRTFQKENIGHSVFQKDGEQFVQLKRRNNIDFENLTYLAPLTTVGNLPFRRVCKEFGVDITCGEMALANKLLSGTFSEWALIKRHSTEDIFGVQLCGAHVDVLAKACEVICSACNVDFIDLNVGCPIDIICHKGCGAGLMKKKTRLECILRGMCSIVPDSIDITVKMRAGYGMTERNAEKHFYGYSQAGVSALAIHGRSRQQRYTKEADWDYLASCRPLVNEKGLQFLGNGDIYTYQEYYKKKELMKGGGILIARGALIKPWIFTEIKEKRDWDISSSERFDFLQRYVNYGLEHWGSDEQGVDKTRRFLLEWLSFLHRYVPLGLLERPDYVAPRMKINLRPDSYVGRNDLETLMGSAHVEDWIKISSLFLGKPKDGFLFTPKHKANSYARKANVDI